MDLQGYFIPRQPLCSLDATLHGVSILIYQPLQLKYSKFILDIIDSLDMTMLFLHPRKIELTKVFCYDHYPFKQFGYIVTFLGAVLLKLRSSLPSTKYTSLGANLPP